MGPLPKRKVSKTRRDKRRAHDHLTPAAPGSLRRLQRVQTRASGLPELRFVQWS